MSVSSTRPSSSPNQRPRKRLSRVTAAVAVPAVAGLMSVAATSPASAAYTQESYISSNSGGANLRQSPNTGATSFGYMSNGTRLHMVCWVDAQTVSPPSSNYTSARWFYIGTTSLGGTFGYVHSSLVAAQIGVPHC